MMSLHPPQTATWFLSALLLLGFSGCSSTLVDRLTPTEGTPETPPEFRRAGESDRGDASASAKTDEWWKAFRDPILDDLVDRVEIANPTVAAALARVERAQAVMGLSGSERFPTLEGDAFVIRQRDSLNNLLFPIDNNKYTRYRVAVNATWEVDLWGKVRGAYEQDRLEAEAARADYEAILLSLRATMARQYFALRFTESEASIIQDAIAVRAKAYQLQQSRVENGAGIAADASRARLELENVRGDLQALQRTRGKLEHAIAILAGEAPSELVPPAGRPPQSLPKIPSGLPVELLARRPDLRAEEGRLRAKAQQVGIRKTEFLPSLRLTGVGGVASLDRSVLFGDGDSSLYNFGPQLDVPIFRGGLLRAAVDEAEAEWRESVATYHATFLAAIGEVDDSLLDLQWLDQQVATQAKAAEAAERTVASSIKRYKEGLVSYLEVVESDRDLLQARRAYNQLRGERAAATVQLIQALGGRW